MMQQMHFYMILYLILANSCKVYINSLLFIVLWGKKVCKGIDDNFQLSTLRFNHSYIRCIQDHEILMLKGWNYTFFILRNE